jgi:hypothetical protein
MQDVESFENAAFAASSSSFFAARSDVASGAGITGGST